MTFQQHLIRATADLEAARNLVQDEIRGYPTPISGCDAQYNHLIGLRNAITDALGTLQTPSFVATPRTPSPGAGIESR